MNDKIKDSRHTVFPVPVGISRMQCPLENYYTAINLPESQVLPQVLACTHTVLDIRYRMENWHLNPRFWTWTVSITTSYFILVINLIICAQSLRGGTLVLWQTRWTLNLPVIQPSPKKDQLKLTWNKVRHITGALVVNLQVSPSVTGLIRDLSSNPFNFFGTNPTNKTLVFVVVS